MSEPIVPPPPAKKGLSTGAKVAIGCLLAVALLVGGCFVVSAFFLKKGVDAVKGFAEDAEKDPNAAAVKAVEMIMRFNPEVDVVSSDPKSGTITLREKKSGKVVTFNAVDIKQGKFSFEADGEQVEFDASAGADGESGSLEIKSNKGKMVFGGDASAVPSWVPNYPGARADGYSNLEANGERSGTFTIHTPDDVQKVVAYYEAELEAAGFEVSKSTLDISGAVTANLNAQADKRGVNVVVSSQEGETQGLVAYSEKP